MNVLHLQLFGSIGGMQTICREIHLQSQKYNCFYFLFDGGPIADQIKDNNGEVYIEHASHYFFYGSLKRFIEYCKHKNIDVIICHAGSPIAWIHMIVASYYLKNAKFGLYEHGDIIDMVGEHGIKMSVKKTIMRKAIKRADFVVAVSEFVKKRNEQVLKIKTDKVHVVYNGIRPEIYRTTHHDEGVFKIIYIGRIFKKKGLHILIDALQYLPNNMNYELNIVGEGEELVHLEEQVKNNNIKNVYFRGAQSNIPEWLENQDLFVHPAIWEEGFGITLIEAMASGVPCVAFRKGAIPEIIQENYNGFIVDTVAPQELAKCIEKCYKLFNNRNYEYLRSGARVTGEKFSIEKTVAELERIYEE